VSIDDSAAGSNGCASDRACPIAETAARPVRLTLLASIDGDILCIAPGCMQGLHTMLHDMETFKHKNVLRSYREQLSASVRKLYHPVSLDFVRQELTRALPQRRYVVIHGDKLSILDEQKAMSTEYYDIIQMVKRYDQTVEVPLLIITSDDASDQPSAAMVMQDRDRVEPMKAIMLSLMCTRRCALLKNMSRSRQSFHLTQLIFDGLGPHVDTMYSLRFISDGTSDDTKENRQGTSLLSVAQRGAANVMKPMTARRHQHARLDWKKYVTRQHTLKVALQQPRPPGGCT
jgi:hypothetical protein